jgi:DNA invertase Pin-like site-specific DNA recombinase
MADRQERYVYPMRGTSIPKEIVEKIRAEESTYNEIAKKYNVSHGTINAIKHRKFERFQ